MLRHQERNPPLRLWPVSGKNIVSTDVVAIAPGVRFTENRPIRTSAALKVESSLRKVLVPSSPTPADGLPPIWIE